MSFKPYALAILGLAAVSSFAGPFTAGNIVVTRLGSGENALVAAVSTAVFLDEYTPGGLLVQSIPVPTADAGSNKAMTNSSSATSELALLKSVDGNYLTWAGYNAAPGVASIAGTTTATNKRVVGRVGANGVIDTSTTLGDGYSGNNPRSALALDATTIYTGGTASLAANAGVRIATFGVDGSTRVSGATVTNFRVLGAAFGQLYCTSGSGAGKGVNTIGSGFPTSDSGSALLAGFSADSAQDPYGFYFANENTVYVGDARTIANGGGIVKWTFDGSQWNKAYTLSSGITDPVTQLTGVTNEGVTTLYAISTASSGTAAGKIVTVTDTGADSEFFTLATGATNTRLRGIAFAPASAATRVNASSVSTTIGSRFSGNLASLTDVDSNRYCAFDNDDLTTEITIGATLSGTVHSVRFVAVTNAARTGLQYNIGFYNVNTETFDDFTSDEETLADSQKEIETSDVNSYILSNVIKAHVLWFPFNDETPSQDGWLTCINQAYFEVQ